MSNRILVIDDESDICFVLQSVLGGNGFVVDSYDDPHIALKKFKADLYNSVILDIKMPDLNGFVYREIRRLDRKVKAILRLAKCTMDCLQIYFLRYLPIVLSENQLKTKN
jgi:DNA-binding response OmpR family regulator